MNKIKLDILGGTFSNLHVTNRKSNISSIVEAMNMAENHSIKLITTSPREEYFRMKHLRKKMKNIKQAMTLTNDIESKKVNFPLIEKEKKSKKDVKKLILSDINKTINKKESPLKKRKLTINKRNLQIKEYKCLTEKRNKNKNINENIEETKKSSIFKEPKKEEKTIINSENKKSNLFSLTKHHQIHTIFDRNFNNNKLYKRNNFITESKNKEEKDKLYQTAKLFSEQKLFSNRKQHIKRKPALLKTKSVNTVKSIPHLKISEAKLIDIENKLNTVYETNKNDFIEKDKSIQQFKKKYQNILNDNEKLYSYEIAQISKEINSQLLSLKFNDFYHYLLTILKNSDRHIVDWKFDIEKDKNECPSELRLKNVKKRHKKFMEKLYKQYNSGLRANKIMNDILLNSKKKDLFYKNIQNNNNFYDFFNKKLEKDDLINKIFENNHENDDINLIKEDMQ